MCGELTPPAVTDQRFHEGRGGQNKEACLSRGSRTTHPWWEGGTKQRGMGGLTQPAAIDQRSHGGRGERMGGKWRARVAHSGRPSTTNQRSLGSKAGAEKR